MDCTGSCNRFPCDSANNERVNGCQIVLPNLPQVADAAMAGLLVAPASECGKI